MAEEFGEGLDTNPAATVTEPVAAQVTDQVATPSASMLEFFRSKVGDVEGIENDDQLADTLGQVLDRDTLVRTKLGELDEQRLNALLEAEQRYQQFAPQLSEFEKWRQQQQLQPQQPAPQQPTPEQKRRWDRMEFDRNDLQYLEPDAATGMYRPKRPELAALAEKANAFVRRQREIFNEATADPYEFGREIVSPHLTPLQQQLQQLQQQLQALQAQQSQQGEWDQFYAQHGNDLQAFDLKTGKYTNTPAGEVFNREVAQLISDGIDAAKAREIALRHAREVTQSATVGTAPTKPKPRVVSRLKPQSTDVVPDASGTLSLPVQNDRQLTGRARMEQIIQQAMHAEGLAYQG